MFTVVTRLLCFFTIVLFDFGSCLIATAIKLLDNMATTVFTYRYFLHRFPQLCILALDETTNEPVGCVVGKMDKENEKKAGYIGMLAVDKTRRRKGIGRALVKRVLHRMYAMGCASATLETEVSNKAAQRLYQEAFGFVREELLVRYYLNWGDAYRLRLWFDIKEGDKQPKN